MVARISHLYNQVKCSLGESSLDFFLFDLVYLAHLCTYQTYNFASKNENSLCLPLSSAIDIRSRFIIQKETVEIVITAAVDYRSTYRYKRKSAWWYTIRAPSSNI